MADGFIVRKGGVTTEQALAPTITEVSTTTTSITFTITNNDASTAVILYELDDATPDANSIELAAAATSGSITVSDLAEDTAFDVYATANVTGKVKSNVTELEISTDVPIVYTAATGGTTAEYNDGGTRYKSHTFLEDGTFTVTTVGDATDDRNKVDYLIIAGGGSGGSNRGGGGGAGGYRTTNGTSGADSSARDKVVVTAQGYSIFVGSGGAVAPLGNESGNAGTNSLGLGITSLGGGFGGGFNDGSSVGGSGGGGGHATNTGKQNGSAGTANEGFAGGAGGALTGSDGGGGGGGANQAGASVSGVNAGKGGDGLANLLRTGSNETRAGGGGGGTRSTTNVGAGGAGGGGAGGKASAGVAGTTNTGSGGGGGGQDGNVASGAGGSGIVVIRYEIAPSV